MKQKPKVFVLLGRGGAGKTESSSFLARKTGLPVIPLGNFIREMAAEGNRGAQVAVESMKKGKYFAGGISILMIKEYFKRHPAEIKSGFILDGFPRRLIDAKLFEQFLEKNGFELGQIFEFRVPNEVSIQRQQQRKRESKATISARQQEFEREEAKIIRYFRGKGLVTVVQTHTHRKLRPPAGQPDLQHKPLLRRFSNQTAKTINRVLGIKKRGKFARKHAARLRRLK